MSEARETTQKGARVGYHCERDRGDEQAIFEAELSEGSVLPILMIFEYAGFRRKYR